MRWDTLQDLIAWREGGRRAGGAGTGWSPPADVFETADGYVVTLEIAGLTLDDFAVRASDERLTISGHRAGDATPGAFLHVERGYGQFSRTFAFPDRVDVSAVSADYRDGLLTVTVPKLPAVRTNVVVDDA